MNRNHNLLLHPVMLGSLFLLFVNDISWKYHFHNTITGKLSDVTGLFAFTVFFLVFFPNRKWLTCLLIGVLFIWWKSSFSTPFIEWFNTISPVAIHRVIDYTDLIALPSIFLGFWFVSGVRPIPVRKPLFVKFASVLCVFTFCHTSVYRHMPYYYSPDTRHYDETFNTRKTDEEVLSLFEKAGASWRMDSIQYQQLRNEEIYYLRRSGDSVLWIPTGVKASGDSVLYQQHKFGPYYVIDQYIIDTDTLRDIELTISGLKDKKRRVTIRSFKTTADTGTILEEKSRKRYRKHFRKLF